MRRKFDALGRAVLNRRDALNLISIDVAESGLVTRFALDYALRARIKVRGDDWQVAVRRGMAEFERRSAAAARP